MTWFDVDVKVPAGTPFVLRVRETFGGPEEKHYSIYVDHIRAKAVVTSRTQTGAGSNVYDVLVDEQWILQDTRDGVMNLMFTRDPGTGGTPSISDVWVLPADDPAAAGPGGEPDRRHDRPQRLVPCRAQGHPPGDRQPRSGPHRPGQGPHARSPGTWQDYTGPLTVTGDARHSYTYQACDATGNWSPVKTVQVNLDNTAPTTTATVVSTAGQASVTLLRHRSPQPQRGRRHPLPHRRRRLADNHRRGRRRHRLRLAHGRLPRHRPGRQLRETEGHHLHHPLNAVSCTRRLRPRSRAARRHRPAFSGSW